jgi:hypothetical protein
VSDLSAYHAFLRTKRKAFEGQGMDRIPELNPALFPHQRACVDFSLRAGRTAMFLDTGLGKSFASLEWARIIVEATNEPVLMLAPLAVGPQHAREAERFGIEAEYVREAPPALTPKVWITNYERLAKFDVSRFVGVILDESSILKSFTGATTRALIEAFANMPFRLACTATPAPNDHTELGTHAEFLGVMRREEMLPRWFINDAADTGTWRLKRHAVGDFWRWVATWARALAKPSDLGFNDEGYELPELIVRHHLVEADRSIDPGEEKRGKEKGQMRLFRIPETSATSIHAEKRLSIKDRADRVAELVLAEPGEPWIIWVDTDYEADAVMARLPDAREVRGSQTIIAKELTLDAFAKGQLKQIVTKPRIAGYGLNWQHCARQCFAGLSFSYENYYQAIRRSWRFGQARPVHVHLVMADTEAAIWEVVKRKAGDHDAMKREMQRAMRGVVEQQKPKAVVEAPRVALPAWMECA